MRTEEYVIFLDGNMRICDMTAVVSYRKRLSFYGVGKLEATVCGTALPEDAVYICFPEGKNLGIIDRVDYSLGSGGLSAQISAECAEGLLMLRCITDNLLLSGTPDEVCGELVRRYCMSGSGRIDCLGISDGSCGRTDTVNAAAGGEKLGMRLYSMLRPLGLSCRIDCDYENSLMYFGVYGGADRTLAQNENRRVLFSESLGDILSVKAVCPALPYTVCHVIDGDGLAVRAELGGTEGRLEREYLLELSCRRGSSDAEAYRHALVSAGLEKLAGLNAPGYIDIAAACHNGDEYSAGDICELECSVQMLCGAHRIVSIDETACNGQRSVTVRTEL